MIVNTARSRHLDPDLGVSYEEYHPYGTTAWQAPELTTVSLKRYKYTGMERDEETGLQRHGVRYYATWLGRWTSADPIGLGDGVNRYAYCHGGPTGGADISGMQEGSDPQPDLDADADASNPDPAVSQGWRSFMYRASDALSIDEIIVAAAPGARRLTENEVSEARKVYGDSIDYSDVFLVNGFVVPQPILEELLAKVGSKVPGGFTLPIGGPLMKTQRFDEKGNLTPLGMETLIHELGHVWQFQKGFIGGEYFVEAAGLQIEIVAKPILEKLGIDASKLRTQDQVYKDFKVQLYQDKAFTSLNVEAQAEAMTYYYQSLKKAEGGDWSAMFDVKKFGPWVKYVQDPLNPAIRPPEK